MGKFDGKVVLITGCSTGMGQAASLKFGKEGANLVIHGPDEESLQKTDELLQAAGVPEYLKVWGMLEDPSTPTKIINATLEKFGKIDVLINNAGIMAKPGITDEFTDLLANSDYLYYVNFRAPVELTTLALPHLEKTKGNVVNLASVVSTLSLHSLVVYGALKAALSQFTRNTALIWGPKGVRLNCVNPGPIRTNFLERPGILKDEQREFFEKYFAETTVLGRMGLPHEMANVMFFLASDEASYVTGADYYADGGMSFFFPNPMPLAN